MFAALRLGVLPVLLFACAGSAEPSPIAHGGEAACRAGEIERTLQTQASAPVILLLTETGGDLRARQDRLLGELGAEFQLERRYESLPGLAGTITRAGYARASKHADVQCVQFDGGGGGG